MAKTDVVQVAEAILELAAATDRVVEIRRGELEEWRQAREEDLERMAREREEDMAFRRETEQTNFDRAVRLREMDRTAGIERAMAEAEAFWKKQGER